MNLIRKNIIIAMVIIYIVTLFPLQIVAADAEGDQQKIDITESYDANDEVETISVAMAIKRAEDVSFELRFAGKILYNSPKVFSAARFSEAGKLLIKDTSESIDRNTEDSTALRYSRAEFLLVRNIF